MARLSTSPRLSAAEIRAAMLDPEGYILRQRRRLAWSRLEKLMLHAKSEMVALLATKELLARLDPVPREPVVAIQDQRRYTWIVPSIPEALRSSDPRPLNGSPTNGSNGSTSSSVIGDGAKPDWL